MSVTNQCDDMAWPASQSVGSQIRAIVEFFRAARTSFFVLGSTSARSPVSTQDTVAVDTPASRETILHPDHTKFLYRLPFAGRQTSWIGGRSRRNSTDLSTITSP